MKTSVWSVWGCGAPPPNYARPPRTLLMPFSPEDRSAGGGGGGRGAGEAGGGVAGAGPALGTGLRTVRRPVLPDRWRGAGEAGAEALWMPWLAERGLALLAAEMVAQAPAEPSTPS